MWGADNSDAVDKPESLHVSLSMLWSPRVRRGARLLRHLSDLQLGGRRAPAPVRDFTRRRRQSFVPHQRAARVRSAVWSTVSKASRCTGPFGDGPRLAADR